MKALRRVRHRTACRVAVAGLAFGSLLAGGCATRHPIERTRLPYNEAVKQTAEEQLLLNIVRLRYTETPSSLAVSSIAAQFEVQRSLGITPFFTATGAGGSDRIGRFGAILPQASYTSADRPTISLTPMDDTEFTRRLFTPITLESVLYLAKTTWPISTVFRLYLENLNWVPNAEDASGPTPERPSPFADFLRGMTALQTLQDDGHLVFGTEERTEAVGSPIAASAVRAADLVEAAKANSTFQADAAGKTYSLTRKANHPVVHIDPRAFGTPALTEFVRTFHLEPNRTKYDITVESTKPFSLDTPGARTGSLDLETRSLLQTLYFISQGVEVPADHLAAKLAAVTHELSGKPFDWSPAMRGLFRVRCAAGARPAGAAVAVPYRGRWFYIEATDHITKSTFSLVLELSRLELNTAKTSAGPLLTLPLGGP